jgi:RND superfamily putative drug exporter
VLTRLLTLPAGKRAKWIVLILWLIPVLALGSLSGKLTSAEKNDPSNFTPSGAESTLVTHLDTTVFPHGNAAFAIVVYHRAGGLTAADYAREREDLAFFAGPGRPPLAAAPIPGKPAADGKLISFSMAILSNDPQVLQRAVDVMRMVVSRQSLDAAQIRQQFPTLPPSQVQAVAAYLTAHHREQANAPDVAVTGPAGILVDAIAVFGSIDATVLLATVALVLVLLLIIYRSPVIALLPLLSVFAAYSIAAAIIYLLATHAGLAVNGEAGGLLAVLMFGAGTDYALLLVARYREELHRYADRHEAMAVALANASPAILSSGVTVASAMLVLLLATLRSTHDLGPVLALGVGAALLAGLTLLPALLQIAGRRAFWPLVPRVDHSQPLSGGFWLSVGRSVARRPRAAIVLTGVVLLIGALGSFTAQENLNFLNGLGGNPESVRGFAYIRASEPAGVLAPTTVVVRPPSALPAIDAAIRRTPRVTLAPYPPTLAGGYAKVSVILQDNPYGSAAMQTIQLLRARVHAAAPAGSTVLVGGDSAVQYDTQQASNRDLLVIAPVILVVILVILSLLLRAVVAPLYLIGTVLLSFFASFGISVVIFQHLLGYAGIDPGFPTLLFLFLVALGVDYNIFLMSRVREETAAHGTAQGVVRGLAATGSIITSAGVILAGTFAVLCSLPLLQLVELGFAVALGVLVDTVLVRSILVPAIVLTIGNRSWWPGRLAKGPVPGANKSEESTRVAYLPAQRRSAGFKQL